MFVIYKIGRYSLQLQECDSGWDYSIFDEANNLIDGGQIDNPQLSAPKAASEIRNAFPKLFPKYVPTTTTIKLQNDASIDFDWYHQLKENPDIEINLLVRDLNPDMVHALLRVSSQVHLYIAVSGYSGTIVEPNTKGIDQVLGAAETLLQKGFPKNHLIMVVDPIIPTQKGIKRADEVFYQFRGIVDYVIAAPMVLYPIMKKRFKEAGIKTPPGLTPQDFSEGVVPEEITILVNQWRQEFPQKSIDIMSEQMKNTFVQSTVQCFFQCPHCYCKDRNLIEEQAQNDEILLK